MTRRTYLLGDGRVAAVVLPAEDGRRRRPSAGQYETDDGRKGQSAEVTADDLGLSLLFATATLTRATSNGATTSEPAGRPADAPF